MVEICKIQLQHGKANSAKENISEILYTESFKPQLNHACLLKVNFKFVQTDCQCFFSYNVCCWNRKYWKNRHVLQNSVKSVLVLIELFISIKFTKVRFLKYLPNHRIRHNYHLMEYFFRQWFFSFIIYEILIVQSNHIIDSNYHLI
jgi:hypothetical protein